MLESRQRAPFAHTNSSIDLYQDRVIAASAGKSGSGVVSSEKTEGGLFLQGNGNGNAHGQGSDLPGLSVDKQQASTTTGLGLGQSHSHHPNGQRDSKYNNNSSIWGLTRQGSFGDLNGNKNLVNAGGGGLGGNLNTGTTNTSGRMDGSGSMNGIGIGHGNTRGHGHVNGGIGGGGGSGRRPIITDSGNTSEADSSSDTYFPHYDSPPPEPFANIGGTSSSYGIPASESVSHHQLQQKQQQQQQQHPSSQLHGHGHSNTDPNVHANPNAYSLHSSSSSQPSYSGYASGFQPMDASSGKRKAALGQPVATPYLADGNGNANHGPNGVGVGGLGSGFEKLHLPGGRHSMSGSNSRTGSSSSIPFQTTLTRILAIQRPTLSSVKFIARCTLWYSCSALSSNTGKVIMTNFRYPITLTIVQFFFVAGYCWLVTDGIRILGIAKAFRIILSKIPGSSRRLSTHRRSSSTSFGAVGSTSASHSHGGLGPVRLKKPTRQILHNTWPMAVFQVGGHIFSSMAISRVPVSTVHTIKALSPLFTVLAYAFIFGVSYSPATYLSLLPLTLGVMLTMSFDLSFSNALGLICAFGSTLVFVSSNIVFKKIMPTIAGSTSSSSHAGQAAGSHAKLDKINLLFFSSGMAFIIMLPLWAYYDMPALFQMWMDPARHAAAAAASTGPNVPYYFWLNGTVHFAQNYLAFAILSSTSPVTYSIASLVKRIAVICLAIIWFKQNVHPIQAFGIALTGLGLWMYNNAKRDVEQGEKKIRRMELAKDGMLPLNRADSIMLDSRAVTPEPVYMSLLENGNNKHLHASPTPKYSDDGMLAKSMTSAYQINGFSLPPPQMNYGFAAGPYPSSSSALPSPPASNSNPSPPMAHALAPPLNASGPPRGSRRRSNDQAMAPPKFEKGKKQHQQLQSGGLDATEEVAI